MNKLRKVILAVSMLIGIIAMASTATAADDYFVYGVEKTLHCTNAIDGYVINDESGLLYVADWYGNCYIYKVSIPEGSDPDKHPDNPLNTGPMAPRTFEPIGDKYYFKGDCGWEAYHRAEFYISDDHIYYGVSTGGIEKWNKNKCILHLWNTSAGSRWF